MSGIRLGHVNFCTIWILTRIDMKFVEVYVIANPKGEAISDCTQGECRTFQSYLSVSVCVCPCVSKHDVLSAMKLSTPHRYIGIFEVTLWLGHYCDART